MVTRSGAKVAGKHQKYEIEDMYGENDRDHPGEPTLKSVFINHKHNPTSVFHVAKYRESNEFKSTSMARHVITHGDQILDFLWRIIFYLNLFQRLVTQVVLKLSA